ncbi:MAG: hypothetical protein PHO37_04720 [Kiritimatiellae bacterium]|nr:hypothetical protein [Kiritimatiellia bacterium]
MSKLKTDSGAQQWFLRTAESTEFGPIEKSGLKLWAEQARVLPGHQVSTDKITWVPATSVDFLDMNWFIDDGDGDFKGPLNRLAAEALIKSGKFSAAARVIAAAQIDEPQAKDFASAESRGKQLPRTERSKEQAVTETADLSEREYNELSRRCDTLASERDELKQSFETLAKERDKLKQSSEALASERDKLKQSCETLAGERDKLKRACTAVAAERDAAVAALDAMVAEREICQATQAAAGRSFEEFEAKARQLEKQVQDAVRARESALQQSRESERSFARLLNEANQRDTNYKTQIEALKKANVLSPEATERFYSEQNAVFQILKREAELITKTMDSERAHLDAFKTTASLRLQELEKQRQALRNLLGSTPVEMTSRALREQTEDPRIERLRSERDNLRLMHERSSRQAEEREWELNYRLKVMQTDYAKLMDEMLKKESESVAAQQLADKLSVTERELAELRRNYDAERKQFAASNHAMAAKIGELENGFKGAAEPGQLQSSEARGVKLASWMSFKK